MTASWREMAHVLADKMVAEDVMRTPAWREFETAYRMWDGVGRPGWERLGLTVTADGVHRVWLDHPASRTRWPLPAR